MPEKDKQNKSKETPAALSGKQKEEAAYGEKTPEEKAAELLALGKVRLKALEDKKERPKRFAALPKGTKELEALRFLTAEERAQFLREPLEEKPMTRKQKFLFSKLSYLQYLTEQLMRGKILSFRLLAKSQLGTEKSRPYTANEWFKKNTHRLSLSIMTDENFDLDGELPGFVNAILIHYAGVISETIRDQNSVYAAYDRLMQKMREAGDWEEAQLLMESLLDDEFKKGREKLGGEWIFQIKNKAARKIFNEVYIPHQKAWKQAGMSDEQIDKYYNELIRIEQEREINKRVAEHILGKKIKIPSQKQAIWNHYLDMLDPKNEFFKMSDEGWAHLKKEVAINLPMIVLSGGIASFARASAGKIGMRYLARHGVKEFAAGTIRSDIMRYVAQKGGGLLVEGAVFDATHRALTVQQYESLTDWAQSVVWSCITLGLFHGSGKLSHKAFQRQISGQLPVKTWLEKAVVPNIKNQAVQETVRVLILKGHVEAATMLIVGAIQNKAYGGSIKEFMDNIGDEILHSYVSVGGLKLSGKIMQPWMKILAVKPEAGEFNLKPETKREILERLRDPKIPKAKKQEIIDAIRENYSHELGPQSDLAARIREIDSFLLGEGAYGARAAEQPQARMTEETEREAEVRAPEAADRLSDIHSRNAASFRNLVNLNEKLAGIAERCRLMTENLPKEERHAYESTAILRRIKDSLTPEQRALPEHKQKALIRHRFYEAMTRLSQIAGKVMESMESFVRENPEASMEEIIAHAKEHGFDALNTKARKIMREAILRFERNREMIRETLQTFSSADLFFNVFGFKPYGEVRIDTSNLFAIHFIVDPIDFARVENRRITHGSRAAIETFLKENPLRAGGFKMGSAGKIPPLDGLITVGRSDAHFSESQRVFKHEERHAMHDAFFSRGERFGKLGEHRHRAEEAQKQLYEKQKEFDGDERFSRALTEEFPKILDQYKKSFLERVKDEIVAYLKDGMDVARIAQELRKTGKSALYDYPGEMRDAILGGWVPQGAEMRNRLFERMRKSYYDALDQALFIAIELTYIPQETERLLAEMATTPIEAWPDIFGNRINLPRIRNEAIENLRKRAREFRDEDAGSYTDYSEFTGAIANLSDLFSGGELGRVVQEAGFTRIVREIFERNIEFANQADLDKSNAFREKFIPEMAKDLQNLMDRLPVSVAEVVARELLPFLAKVENQELRDVLRKALAAPESLPIESAGGSTAPIEGAVVLPERPAAASYEPGERDTASERGRLAGQSGSRPGQRKGPPPLPEEALRESPRVNIEGPLKKAIQKPNWRGRFGFGHENAATVEGRLREMAEDRPREFEFLNREFRNIAPEIARNMILGNGEAIRHHEGGEGRVYNGTEIGRGGLGMVSDGLFISADGAISRPVVVKEAYYSESTTEEARRQVAKAFEFEQQAARYLQHLRSNDPNYPDSLIHVAGVGEKVIMYEKVEDIHSETGRPQTINLDYARARMSTGEIVQVLRDAVSAIMYLHQKGIFYSDFKPSNIMLRRDAQGRRRGTLIDIGTIIGTRRGQPSYLASLDGIGFTPTYADMPLYRDMNGTGEINFSADVYAIGQTIFYLLGHYEMMQLPPAYDSFMRDFEAEAPMRELGPLERQLFILALDCQTWRTTGITASQVLDRLRSIR